MNNLKQPTEAEIQEAAKEYCRSIGSSITGPAYSAYIAGSRQNSSIVVFKDATYIHCLPNESWEYENDKNWLMTIPSTQLFQQQQPATPERISDEQFMDKYQCETCACDEPCQIEYNRLRSIPEQKGVEQGEERFFHVIFVSGEGSVFPSQKLFINQQSAVDYSRDFAARCIVDNDLPQLDPNSRLSVLEYMVVD